MAKHRGSGRRGNFQICSSFEFLVGSVRIAPWRLRSVLPDRACDGDSRREMDHSDLARDDAGQHEVQRYTSRRSAHVACPAFASAHDARQCGYGAQAAKGPPRGISAQRSRTGAGADRAEPGGMEQGMAARDAERGPRRPRPHHVGHAPAHEPGPDADPEGGDPLRVHRPAPRQAHALDHPRQRRDRPVPERSGLRDRSFRPDRQLHRQSGLVWRSRTAHALREGAIDLHGPRACATTFPPGCSST
jgi:hypothetical protein